MKKGHIRFGILFIVMLIGISLMSVFVSAASCSATGYNWRVEGYYNTDCSGGLSGIGDSRCVTFGSHSSCVNMGTWGQHWTSLGSESFSWTCADPGYSESYTCSGSEASRQYYTGVCGNLWSDNNECYTSCGASTSAYVRYSAWDYKCCSYPTCYRDVDTDGFGNISITNNTGCNACISGYVLNSTDCNDNDTQVWANKSWYKDNDTDHYYASNVTSCSRPATDYYVNVSNCTVSTLSGCLYNETLLGGNDCNDSNACVFNASLIWYLDVDNDNYYPSSAISCDRPTINYYAPTNVPNASCGLKVMAGNNDCDDSDPQVNPSIAEANFTKCINGKDDDCDTKVDYLDSVCQINCSTGYTELLRYNNSDLSKSYVMNPGTSVPNKYQYYFPLCINATIGGTTVLDTSCSATNALPVLWQNPTTKEVSSNANPPNGFTNEICLNGNDSYVSAGACNANHVAIASMTADEGASLLGHPTNVSSAYKLCVAFSSIGVSFNNTASTTSYFPCKTISDGICPEDFENQFGNRVSCANYHDPDCGFASKFYTSSLFRKSTFLMNFSEKSYVISSSNSNNSLVSIYNESDNVSAHNYNYQFALTSDVHSDFSKTDIIFSTGSLPNVSFDGNVVSDCSVFGIPTSASDLVGNYAPAKACFVWTSNSHTLTLYHQLSDHKLDVKFDYGSVSMLLIIFLIFAVLVPLFLVKRSHISLKLSFKKKDEATVEQKIAQLGKIELELENYIQKALEKKTPKSTIYATLLNIGWDKKDIDRVFNRVNDNISGKVKGRDK